MRARARRLSALYTFVDLNGAALLEQAVVYTGIFLFDFCITDTDECQCSHESRYCVIFS